MKTSHVRQRAIVLQVQKGGRYQLCLQDMPEYHVVAYLCGKMRAERIRIVRGDEVDVELSVYALDTGRIVWRHDF